MDTFYTLTLFITYFDVMADLADIIDVAALAVEQQVPAPLDLLLNAFSITYPVEHL